MIRRRDVLLRGALRSCRRAKIATFQIAEFVRRREKSVMPSVMHDNSCGIRANFDDKCFGHGVSFADLAGALRQTL